jgi:hypothetical protein
MWTALRCPLSNQPYAPFVNVTGVQLWSPHQCEYTWNIHQRTQRPVVADGHRQSLIAVRQLLLYNKLHHYGQAWRAGDIAIRYYLGSRVLVRWYPAQIVKTAPYTPVAVHRILPELSGVAELMLPNQRRDNNVRHRALSVIQLARTSQEP